MRRLAALAIRGYRRFLSGRGPLRRVRCTFAATESCSAYGLRAVEELSTSLPHALHLVRARIRACRCTSVYRFPAGLGWERDHELAPAQLVDALVARGERTATIAQVLAARTLVARWRGDRAAHVEATQLHTRSISTPISASPAPTTSASISASISPASPASKSVSTPPASTSPASISASISGSPASNADERPIPIRAGDAAIRHHRRAMRRGLALACLALVACWVTLLAVVPLACALAAACASHAAARRLETQRIAATFLRPAVSPMLSR